MAKERHREGHIEHTIGYPLGHTTFGGGFLYHLSDQQVALGLVVALDYRNTYLSPYEEFQRWKDHPFVRRVLEGGTFLTYGAHTIATGAAVSASWFSKCSIVLISWGRGQCPNLSLLHDNAFLCGLGV